MLLEAVAVEQVFDHTSSILRSNPTEAQQPFQLHQAKHSVNTLVNQTGRWGSNGHRSHCLLRVCSENQTIRYFRDWILRKTFCKTKIPFKLFLYMLIVETDDLWERCENDHGWIQLRDFRSTQRYILGTNMIETDVFSMMLRTWSVDMFYSLQYRVNNQLTQVGLLGVFWHFCFSLICLKSWLKVRMGHLTPNFMNIWYK